MRGWFRKGFYGGLGLALLVGLWLIWLWQPERQVEHHNYNFLHAIEKKNWSRAAGFIDHDYRDQWDQDRTVVLARLREVLGYVRKVQIVASNPDVRIADRQGYWRARITIDGEGEAIFLIKERLGFVSTPFEFEWRRVSAKPWHWKLVCVTNSELTLPDNPY